MCVIINVGQKNIIHVEVGLSIKVMNVCTTCLNRFCLSACHLQVMGVRVLCCSSSPRYQILTFRRYLPSILFQFCMLDHYVNTPLSSVCCPSSMLSHAVHSLRSNDIRQLRQLPSLMRFGSGNLAYHCSW